MTKRGLIETIWTETGLTRHECYEIVKAVLETIKDALLTGESVKIVGFGTFNVRKKSSRIGRNPKTMATFEISPRKVITFKPSNKLRRAMAKG